MDPQNMGTGMIFDDAGTLGEAVVTIHNRAIPAVHRCAPF